MLHWLKKGFSASDTVNEIFIVYGNDVKRAQTVCSWFRSSNLEDKERCGRPFTTNKDLIIAMFEENPRYTVSKIANKLEISQSSDKIQMSGFLMN